MINYPDPLEPSSVANPQQFREMPAEYQELVIHQLEVHTEGEATGADDYAKIFYPMTKDPLEKYVCCKHAAEEMDHHLLGAKVLADLGVDVTYMVEQSMGERKLFDNEIVKNIGTWVERGFFGFISEAAAFAQIQEFGESSYKPIADMTPKILQDERGHIAHGFRIIRDMCKTPAGLQEAQAALERMWPATLDLFGRTDSKRSKAYVRWGLRRLRNDDARQRFARATRPKLEKLGLVVPDDLANRKFL